MGRGVRFCLSGFTPLSMPSTPLVLASASPRRVELLSGLGLPFQQVPTHADEPDPTTQDLTAPHQYVTRLARLKAEACTAPGLVIGADTTVWHDGQILNKPGSPDEARSMLRRLRGQTHKVFTGVHLRHGDKALSGHEVTSVTFGDFSDDFIDAYVATGEPMDKAGAYAAQGRGALLVRRIDGDYWNVVGLPLNLLARLLAEFGVDVHRYWPVAS